MDRKIILKPVVLLAAACLVAAPTAAQELSPATYKQLREQIDVKPAELCWQQVHWIDSFWDGLLQAQAKDKPIFYWLYFGDPRGGC